MAYRDMDMDDDEDWEPLPQLLTMQLDQATLPEPADTSHTNSTVPARAVNPVTDPATEEAIATVMEKLRKKYKKERVSISDDRLREFAEPLADEKVMKDTYFQDLIDMDDRAIRETLDEADGGENGFTSLEFERARERAEDRFTQVCSLPVKLVLTAIGADASKRSKRKIAKFTRGRTGATFASILKCEFGAYHTALVVGGIVIEWDDSSLIIPDDHKVTPVFRTDLQQHSFWHRFVSRLKPRMLQSVQKTVEHTLDFNQQADAMVSVRKEKEEIIERLIAEIVRYNREKQYSVRDCNCQHFIKDAMRAVRVFEQPKFTGELDTYFQRLKKGLKHKMKVEYGTHEELDAYVRSNLTQLPQENMEYLLLLYYTFHTQAGMTDPGKWECPRGRACQMDALDKQLDKSALLLYKFTQ